MREFGTTVRFGIEVPTPNAIALRFKPPQSVLVGGLMLSTTADFLRFNCSETWIMKK